jgi:hypothetical protein
MRATRSLASIALICCSCEGIAQQMSSGGVVESLSRCRGIAAPDARLACFDAAASAIEVAVKAKDVTIVDRQDIRKARRSLFGFSVPHIPLFGGGDRDGGPKTDDFAELNTTIASARSVDNGRIELKLAESDAVWMTTDPMAFPPKAGAKVRIRQGAMGNYFIAISGERSVRGIRVR